MTQLDIFGPIAGLPDPPSPGALVCEPYGTAGNWRIRCSLPGHDPDFGLWGGTEKENRVREREHANWHALLGATLEERIVAAAREQGITHITLFDRVEDTEGLVWHSFREVKNGGASGVSLDDFEAAVLIAAGWEWHIYEYDRWPERSYLDGRAPVKSARRKRSAA